MRAWLKKWLFKEEIEQQRTIAYAPLAVATDECGEKIKPHVKVGVVEAMNGKLLEVSSYKQNSRGPDWTTTYWIMDDRPLAEQIGMVLVLKGLDK